MSRYKHCFVEFGGDPSDDKECYKRYTSTEPFEGILPSDEVVHFIEYKAYEKLRSLADNLLESLDKYEYQDDKTREACIKYEEFLKGE